jgi:hypothetical protein
MDFTHDPFNHNMTHGQPNGSAHCFSILRSSEGGGRPYPKAKEKAEIKKSRLPFFLHHESFSDF